MESLRKVLAVVLVMLLSVVSPIAVFAGERPNNDIGENITQVGGELDQDKDDQDVEKDHQDEDKDKDNQDLDEQNQQDEDSNEALEQQKEQLEKDLEALEEQLETAVESGNTELAAQLKVKIADLEAQIDKLEEQKELEEKQWEAAKDALEKEKDEIEVLKDQIEKQIEELEEQCEEAEENGDSALVESLKNQIAELQAKKEAYKVQMKSKIEQMKEVMKENYTQEELEELRAVSAKLESLPHITALPVENVLVLNARVKFDTPPVIKEGRTLVPVRAISEATGALVDWNAAEKKVTITKGDKTITVVPGEDKVYINGTPVAVDVPGQVMNGRTLVPLRFISENLGLKVKWDAETMSIEIK